MSDTNNRLTDTGPSPPDGTTNGTSEPDTQTQTQWCAKCKADVVPRGKGLCPRCGRILRQNFVARKHPVNVLRRQQLLKRLMDDYQPDTTLLQTTCENLAGVLEQLETTKAGTVDHQRLTQSQAQLGATLEDSRVSRKGIEEASYAKQLESMPTEELKARVKYLIRTELELMDDEDREEVIKAVERLRVVNPNGSTGVTIVPRTEPELADDDVYVDVGDDEPQHVPTPTPPCPYCHQTPTRCAELRATRLDDWQAMHYADPEEVNRRADLETKEMFESMRRQSGRW